VLEVMIASVVLVVGILGMVGSLAASIKLVETNQETVLAHQAARGVAERMQNGNFAQVFATYNSNQADDPAGFGTAPGASFDVRGLRVPSGHGHAPVAGARVGSILFPVIPGTSTLSESLVDRELGMPRDLNGDGVITPGAMPGTYLVLPVKITVRWEGAGGTRSLSFNNLLINR
jgi:hypothetical protein